MRGYGVRVIGNHELPEGQEWAMVRTDEDRLVCFVKRRSLSDATLAEASTAYRVLVGQADEVPVRPLH